MFAPSRKAGRGRPIKEVCGGDKSKNSQITITIFVMFLFESLLALILA